MVYCVFRFFGVVHHIWFACVMSWGGGGGGGAWMGFYMWPSQSSWKEQIAAIAVSRWVCGTA